jgi:hypothetical protein
MTRSITKPRVVLLVALALCVGGPPSLLALEHTPEIAVATSDTPYQPPTPPQSIIENGDPDDWASKSDEDEMSGHGVQTLLGGPGGSGVTLREYLEHVSGSLIRIKLYLTGIL